MNKILLFAVALLGTSLVFSCSSQKNTFTNRLYHNTTARFNAYYFAKEKISAFEDEVENAYREDFSQVLPVFFPIDSAIVESQEDLLNEAREMASKAIDWHRISKWVNPSYFLVGKIDYYKGEFDEAQNTFKYLNVNAKQDDVRHLALIQLLRSFIDLKKFDDAAYVIDYLSKETRISKENKQYLYKTLAYYYETRGEQDMIVPSLYKALEFTDNKKESSRLNFIMGQLYQKAGLDAFAYEYYQKSLNGSPNYERTFFAQLYSQQVAELEKSKDLKRVRTYYDDLYKDRKNIEFRDVVLYEKAKFELNQGETEEGIRLLTLAAKEPNENQRQKGYIYQELAEIFLNKKNDYLTTKYYLDSALQNFRETDRNYAALAMQKEIFDQYADNYELLQKNDSLIRLSQLSPEEQEVFVEKFLKSEEDRLIKEAELANAKKSAGIFDNLLAFGGRGSGSSFYWDNAVAMQRGALEFTRVWGNRSLTDNWRRSNRSFQDRSSNDSLEATDSGDPDEALETTAGEDAEDQQPLASQLPDKATLLSHIPKDQESIDLMMDEMEGAYFNLGKLLYFDLKEPKEAIKYLEKLVENYPHSPKKPEAYYTLYLAHKDLGGDFKRFDNLLNTEYPESQYTKSINNPEEVSGSQANFESAQNYKEAYELFKNGEYAQARSIIRTSLDAYPLSKNAERLLLLDIIITGKTEHLDLYRERLETYVNNASNKDLSELATKMLQAVVKGDPDADQPGQLATSESSQEENGLDEKGNKESESDQGDQSPYRDNKNQTHIFILTLSPDVASEAKNLTADLENFHTQKFPNDRLRTGTIALTRETTILIISPFSNANRSISYQKEFLNSFNTEYLTEELKKSSFVISIENFQQLNKRKDIEEYRAFYKVSY
ncbi:gliding motility protein [Negadavirga shengliensis]|uniref:Gliding motility protein n=1 Tax=Negadavirga shengliensis TaxID=1389218 RepID=A0ABV9T0R2_9BACT